MNRLGLYFVQIFAFLFCALPSSGQNQIVESAVVDLNSGRPIVSANVYTDDGKGTITNTDGAFSISAPSDGTISISCLGYETGTFSVNSIGHVVRLRPITYDIKPSVVISIDVDSLEQAMFQKYRQLYQTSTFSGHYFYRQTTLEYGKCSEIIEAVFDAKSDFCLRGPSLVKGRYAELPRDSTTSYNSFLDFFDFSLISFFSPKKLEKKHVMVPLSPQTLKYYDIDVDLMFASSGENIYVLHFLPKKSKYSVSLSGDLYVTADTFKILRYEGVFKCPVKVSSDLKSIDIRYILDYTNMTTVPIVNNVTVSTEFEYKNNFGKASLCKVQSLLTRMNTDLLLQGKKYECSEGTNLLGKIAVMDADDDFWKDNPIIKRTPLEESAIKMFQESNLLGNYHL